MTDATRLRLEPLPPPTPLAHGRVVATRATVAAAIIVVVLLMAGVATNGTHTVRGLRLATATTRTVTKVLHEVGVIEAVSAAGVAFPVSGTVAAVSVSPGTTVMRGQPLATLDSTELQRAVNAAQSAVDQAVVALDSTGRATAPPSTTPTTVPDANDDLDAARAAVLQDQQDVDAKLAAAQEKLDSAAAICDDATSDVQACRDALTAVLAAQRDTAASQSTLADSSEAFDALVADHANDDDDAPSPANTTGDTGAVASAADLAARQKAVDAARIGLAVAKQALAAATIVSPIDGTVEAVNVVTGDRIAANAPGAAVEIAGHGGYEVTAVIGVDVLPTVKIGQYAAVLPDGSSQRETGEVVAIGSPRTTNGSTTYPVSIGLGSSDALANGAVASVAITTASADSVVAVPTSALRVDADQATVTVKDGAALNAVDVTVGVIGTEWTEIVSGVRAGQRVVIADLSEALPGSATQRRNTNRRNR